jgi:hypothetical protein
MVITIICGIPTLAPSGFCFSFLFFLAHWIEKAGGFPLTVEMHYSLFVKLYSDSSTTIRCLTSLASLAFVRCILPEP